MICIKREFLVSLGIDETNVESIMREVASETASQTFAQAGFSSSLARKAAFNEFLSSDDITDPDSFISNLMESQPDAFIQSDAPIFSKPVASPSATPTTDISAYNFVR